MRAVAAALLLLAGSALAQAPSSEIRINGSAVQGGLIRGTAPAGTARLLLDGKPVALAEDGTFLVGLDRDQPAPATLTAELANGLRTTKVISVVPRTWHIERLNIPRRQGGATPEYLKLREGELARIAAARATARASEGWRQRFVRPAGGRISGVFGAQRIYQGEPAAYHSGTDFAAGAGAPVIAPADGVVVLAGPPAFSLEGNLVIIDHGMGLNSAFLHLASANVRVGQPVAQGQLIGTVGATGRATGPHLHWGIKWNEARLDPELLLAAPAAR